MNNRLRYWNGQNKKGERAFKYKNVGLRKCPVQSRPLDYRVTVTCLPTTRLVMEWRHNPTPQPNATTQRHKTQGHSMKRKKKKKQQVRKKEGRTDRRKRATKSPTDNASRPRTLSFKTFTMATSRIVFCSTVGPDRPTVRVWQEIRDTTRWWYSRSCFAVIVGCTTIA